MHRETVHIALSCKSLLRYPLAFMGLYIHIRNKFLSKIREKNRFHSRVIELENDEDKREESLEGATFLPATDDCRVCREFVLLAGSLDRSNF